MSIFGRASVALLTLVFGALPCSLFAQSGFRAIEADTIFTPAPSLADTVKVQKTVPIVITLQKGIVEAKDTETTDGEVRACKERDAALVKMNSAYDESDSIYRRNIGRNTPQAQAAITAGFKNFDAALSAYYKADDRCNALPTTSSGKSISKDGSMAGRSKASSSTFVDQLPTISGNRQMGDRPSRIEPSIGPYSGPLCEWAPRQQRRMDAQCGFNDLGAPNEAIWECGRTLRNGVCVPSCRFVECPSS